MEANNQNQNTTPNTRSSEGGIDASVLFGNNPHFAFIYKKTEKLVTAVYMITDFIKDNEPLKWQVRESALSLLSINIEFSTASLAERKILIKEYHSLALEIVSLSSIAHHSGLISEMNFQILSREFGGIVSTLTNDEGKKANEETVMLDPGFFSAGDSHKGHSSRTSISAEPTQQSERPLVREIQHKPSKPVSARDDKESRRSVIIKLLSKKGGLNVKDFVDSIKGVSEKTIQRELLAMVASGLIKKEGERRWSTYSLAH